MKILFLSLLFEKEDETKLLECSKIGLQGAINTFQWALIDGLDKNLDIPMQILNSLPIGTYPRFYRELLIHSKSWNHCTGANDKSVGFVNFIGIKQLIRKKRFIKEIERWIISNKNDDLCIIIYDLYCPYLEAVKEIKKKYPRIQTLIIVTDLPNEFGIDTNRKGILKYLTYYTGKKQLRLANCIDKFVLLAENMSIPLNIGSKPYVVVEGICKWEPVQEDENNYIDKSEKKVILYTGTLNKQFGIDRLLYAFEKIENQNYKLLLCGSGDMENEIKKRAKIDKRIQFLGYVSRQEALRLQRTATVLINPRNSDGEYTKYSFPSKTMEYLASGTPLIAYNLDAIPNEYNKYIYYVKGNTVEALKEKICEVCEKKDCERIEFGMHAKNFVIENKNSKVQAMKIISLLSKEKYDDDFKSEEI